MAATSDPAVGWTSQEFFASGAGKMLQSFGTVTGLLSGAGGIGFAARGFMRGLGVKSLKSIAVGIAIGAFLMNMSNISVGLDAGKDVVTQVFNTANQTVEKGK
ncbi:MAG TPA: hypothetical protein VHD87_12760 [Acidimicrobiales bacterium]|nr:hypothetical protein [Acidimicrobiales bacterium]